MIPHINALVILFVQAFIVLHVEPHAEKQSIHSIEEQEHKGKDGQNTNCSVVKERESYFDPVGNAAE